MPFTNWTRKQILERVFSPQNGSVWISLAKERVENGRTGDHSNQQHEANKAARGPRIQVSLALLQDVYTNTQPIVWTNQLRGEYTHFILWNAETDGKALFWDSLDAVISVKQNGDSLTLPATYLFLEVF